MRSVISSNVSGSGRRVAWVAVLVALLAPLASAAFAQGGAQAPKSLYHRVGGYDTIASVVDDFLNQLDADPAFKRFGQGRSVNTLQKGRQLIVDQICNLTGGPCLYIGRDMKPSHAGLAITEAEFASAGQKLMASLKKFKVSEADQKEFMDVIGKLSADIVEIPAKAAAAKPSQED